jgi:hypothetical protein
MIPVARDTAKPKRQAVKKIPRTGAATRATKGRATGERVKLENTRRLILIKAIDVLPNPDIHMLEQATGMPRIAIHRYLKRLREWDHMDIECVRTFKGKRGSEGYYRINSWGLISRRFFNILTINLSPRSKPKTPRIDDKPDHDGGL